MTPHRKAHKFFDSYPQYEHKPADIHANNSSGSLPDILSRDEDVQGTSAVLTTSTGEIIQIPATNVIDSAHYGYVYCMALVPSTREGSDDPPAPRDGRNIQLVTGSGDETVKVCCDNPHLPLPLGFTCLNRQLWECSPNGPLIHHTFHCSQGAVLSIVVRADTIYAGCQDGYVKVWDLETKTLVRTLIVQEVRLFPAKQYLNESISGCWT